MPFRTTILLLGFVLALKLVYLLFAHLLNDLKIAPQPHSISADGYITMGKKNDAYWYQRIANGWYPKITNKRDLGYSEGADFKQSEWAFFPFYPGLMRLTAQGLSLNFGQAAALWSFIFSLFAFTGFFWFCMLFHRGNAPLALFTTLLFILFPFHYYYAVFYTEAPFFTFLIFSFIAIHHRKLWLLPFLLIPLALIRPNGIVMIIPLYLYYLEREGMIAGYNLRWKTIFTGRNILRSLVFLAAPAAFLGYCYYQYVMTGFFFAFSIAQDGWYREFMFPLLAFFRRGDVATQFNSFYTIFVMLYAMLTWKRFPLSLNIFVWISLILPLCSGSVQSMARFMSAIFPLFIFLGEWLYLRKSRYVWLGIIAALHFLTFSFWLAQHPISY